MTSPSVPRPDTSPAWEATRASREAERYRLLALDRCHLLDSGDEERFDRLTRKARTRFGVMASTISLIAHDRQYLKSLAGVLPRTVPRSVSMCTVTIQGEAPLVVPDLLADKRFAENPHVTGPPFVRFYAGVPLRGPGGWFVGSFCLLGTEPRELDTRERLYLNRLAAQAEIEINDIRAT